MQPQHIAFNCRHHVLGKSVGFGMITFNDPVTYNRVSGNRLSKKLNTASEVIFPLAMAAKVTTVWHNGLLTTPVQLKGVRAVG